MKILYYLRGDKMRLTKVDGVSHFKVVKEQNSVGYLKKAKNIGENVDIQTSKIVTERFNKQLESRISREFFSVKGFRLSTLTANNKNEKIQPLRALYFFIHELYSGKDNNSWHSEQLLKRKLVEEIEFLNKNKDVENMIGFKIGYKLHSDKYLCKNEKKDTKTFNELFAKFMEDLKNTPSIIKTNEEVRKLESYLEIKKWMTIYRKRKIELIVNSLRRNRINIYRTKETLDGEDLNKRKYFYMLLLNGISCVADTEKQELEAELATYFTEEIKRFFVEIRSTFKKLVENEMTLAQFRGIIFNKLRALKKQEINVNDSINIVGYSIYKEEIEKYINNNLSKNKQDKKAKENFQVCSKKSELLYINFLKKAFLLDCSEEKALGKWENLIGDSFKNRFTNYIINYGKYKYYKNNGIEIDSTYKLEEIKSLEAIIQKFATLVNFASNSFNSIFDIPVDSSSKISGDFVGGAYKEEHYPLISQIKLDSFFNFNGLDPDQKKVFVEMLRKQIKTIRNCVAHFKKIKDLKWSSKIEIEMEKNIVNIFCEQTCTAINRRLQERFLTNNLLRFYSLAYLKKYLNVYDYNLEKEVIPFSPKFRRVYEKGKKLSLKNNNLDSIDEKYFNTGDKQSYSFEEQKLLAGVHIFMLKELYYNNFLKAFLSNKKDFIQAISLAKKRKTAANRLKTHAYANFTFLEGMEIESYIAELHKKVLDKKFLDNDKIVSEKQQKEKMAYVNDFLEDIFLEGFIIWLEKNDLAFLKSEPILIDSVSEDEMQELQKLLENKFSEKSISGLSAQIKDIYGIIIAFSLVDNKCLSEFTNELAKYKQYLDKKTEKEDRMFLQKIISEYKLAAEIVILTRERIDKNEKYENIKQYYKDDKQYINLIKKFVDFDEQQIRTGGVFFSTDTKTPILHSNIEKMRQFGTIRFLGDLFEQQKGKYKFTKVDENKLKEYKAIDNSQLAISKIQEIYKTKQKLHEEWIKNKEEFSEKQSSEYEKKNMLVREYNYLQEKQTLYNVYRVHAISIDIQARNMAFIQKYERDFKFFMYAIQNVIQEISKENNYIRELYADKVIDVFLNLDGYKLLKGTFDCANYNTIVLEMKFIDNLNKNLAKGGFSRKDWEPFAEVENSEKSALLAKLESDTKLFLQKLNANFICKLFKTVDSQLIRNYIAHFNHFTDYWCGDVNSYCTKSFIEQMNQLIDLFSYDQKISKQVNKSIKNILEKHNLIVKFTYDEKGKQYICPEECLYSKKGKQLGKENYILQEDEFIKLINCLLNYKTSQDNNKL